jgi:hypothetical protein
MMAWHPQRSALVQIAADIINTNTPPSTFLADHEHVPTRVPAKWWRWMCDKLIAAEDERRAWAVRLREIADSLSADKGE